MVNKNKNYISGARFERRLVNFARDNKLISYRSAGSHSPIDVTMIDTLTKTVYFIQSKAKKISKNAKSKIEKGLPEQDEYLIESLVIDKNNIKEFMKRIIQSHKEHDKNAEALHELLQS
jgi:fructose-1,6-bisphosphatase